MTHLFAAHLVQKAPPVLVSGKYDPEQEVWVGDNQLQGVNPFGVTNTNTRMSTTTVNWILTGGAIRDGWDYDSDSGPDSDTDEY